MINQNIILPACCTDVLSSNPQNSFPLSLYVTHVSLLVPTELKIASALAVLVLPPSWPRARSGMDRGSHMSRFPSLEVVPSQDSWPLAPCPDLRTSGSPLVAAAPTELSDVWTRVQSGSLGGWEGQIPGWKGGKQLKGR